MHTETRRRSVKCMSKACPRSKSSEGVESDARCSFGSSLAHGPIVPNRGAEVSTGNGMECQERPYRSIY